MADPLITAASGLIGRLTADLLKSAWSGVKSEIEVFYTPSKIRFLSKKLLSSLESVKTIRNSDKPCKISSFYVSPRFRDSDNNIFAAKTISDFGEDEHPLIEGIAGQGKSIFMRQLCIEEIRKGQRLPVLIELRKISAQKGLQDFAIEFLNTIGFLRAEEILKYMLETGFGVLVLDGYDELADECRMDLIHELSTLIMKYDQLRVVITSRPESSIKGVSFLKTARMCRLNTSERNEIIHKVCSKATAKSLTEKMGKNQNLSEIVDTPLFTTLLCIVYGLESRLPETVHEFYDQVFQTLLYKHDDLKQGYERARKSGLGNFQFGVVFENFCFRSILTKKRRFGQEEAAELISYSLGLEGIDRSLSDKYFNDLLKITCLIVLDGTDYQFLHQSIKEYFAARYVKRLPEDKAKDFYRKIAESPGYITLFSESLRYLYEIDGYRSSKYFALPCLSKAFLGSEDNWQQLSEHNWTGDMIIEVLSDDSVAIGLRKIDDEYQMSSICAEFKKSDALSPRRRLIEHFDLLFPISAAAAFHISKKLSIDESMLSVPDSEAMTCMEMSEEEIELMQVIPVSCVRCIKHFEIQDDIANSVNGSDAMKEFRKRVSLMVDRMEMADNSDMLDFM